MSHEYYNIVIGGEGARRRSNGINAEKITFFSNFVRVSKGRLSTIAVPLVRSETGWAAFQMNDQNSSLRRPSEGTLN